MISSVNAALTFLDGDWQATDLDGLATDSLNDLSAIFCDGALLATIDAPLIDQHLAGGCIVLMAAAPQLRWRLLRLAQAFKALPPSFPPDEAFRQAQHFAEQSLDWLLTLPIPGTDTDEDPLVDPEQV